MKKLFILSPSNKCNKSCDYCVMKKWRNNPDYPDKVTIGDLIIWLEWCPVEAGDHVQITGGEPTLWEDLQALLDYFKYKGAFVSLLTNGARIHDIKRWSYKNLIVTLTRHGTAEYEWQNMKNHLLPFDIARDTLSIAEPTKPDRQTDSKAAWYDDCYVLMNDGNVYSMFCKTDCGVPDKGTIWEPKRRYIGALESPCPPCPMCHHTNNVLGIIKKIPNVKL